VNKNIFALQRDDYNSAAFVIDLLRSVRETNENCGTTNKL